MNFRAADSRYFSQGPAQWQQNFSDGPDPGTSLPLGFEGTPTPDDPVPFPAPPARIMVLGEGALPPLAAPPTLKTIAGDDPPRRQTPPPIIRPQDWTAPPLPALSHSTLDQPPPAAAAAPARRAPDDQALGRLLHPLGQDEMPMRPAWSSRQPSPEPWTGKPLSGMLPWFDASPPHSLQLRGRPELEPSSLPPLVVTGLPPALPDIVPARAPAPPRRLPEETPAGATRPALPDQLPPRVAIAPAIRNLDAWALKALGAISDMVFDAPPPARPPAPPRSTLLIDQSLPALVTPVVLSPFTMASELRPPRLLHPPIFDTWVLPPLPVLRAAPSEPELLRPRAAAPRRPPDDQALPFLRVALADAPLIMPARARPPRPTADEIASRLRPPALQDQLPIVGPGRPPRLPFEDLARGLPAPPADQPPPAPALRVSIPQQDQAGRPLALVLLPVLPDELPMMRIARLPIMPDGFSLPPLFIPPPPVPPLPPWAFGRAGGSATDVVLVAMSESGVIVLPSATDVVLILED